MMERRYGTWRGFVRLQLARVEVALGLGAVVMPDPATVRRLVFVCHGNICRSAFAAAMAARAGLSVASFGLSTRSGKPAYAGAIDAAGAIGCDLTAHLSTALADYDPRPGDLLLGMETRHLRRIAADPRLMALPRSLLGLYCRPVTPHLHDPYQLSDAYMAHCLALISTAIPILAEKFPNARV